MRLQEEESSFSTDLSLIFVAPTRKSAFTPYHAKQRTPRKFDEEDDTVAYYLQDEIDGPNYIEPVVPWSSKYTEDYVLAKDLRIQTKTNMNESTLFKAKQVIIHPKTTKNKVVSSIEDDPKTKKNKVTSSKRSRSHSPTTTDVGEPKTKKNKATTSKRSHSPYEDDDEDYKERAKKNKATTSSYKRSPSSTDENKNDKEMKNLKKKKQKDIEKEMNNKPPITNEVTERLKEFITSDVINGKDIKLVIQKLLYVSDLKPNQNRLTMPINQLKTLEFLTPKEEKLMDDQNSEGLDVELIGPRLIQIYNKPMNLARWKMQTTESYVLKTNWRQFVADHEEDLVENSIIQVWSFRKDDKLCFALAIVKRAEPMQDSPSSS